MKIGDLICFNAGGMKHKTLGLVVDTATQIEFLSSPKTIYLIQWCVAGKYMPRRENNPLDPVRIPIDFRSPKSGDLAWHGNEGKWLEVLK